jgi:hypothetical protein
MGILLEQVAAGLAGVGDELAGLLEVGEGAVYVPSEFVDLAAEFALGVVVGDHAAGELDAVGFGADVGAGLRFFASGPGSLAGAPVEVDVDGGLAVAGGFDFAAGDGRPVGALAVEFGAAGFVEGVTFDVVVEFDLEFEVAGAGVDDASL